MSWVGTSSFGKFSFLPSAGVSSRNPANSARCSIDCHRSLRQSLPDKLSGSSKVKRMSTPPNNWVLSLRPMRKVGAVFLLSVQRSFTRSPFESFSIATTPVGIGASILRPYSEGWERTYNCCYRRHSSPRAISLITYWRGSGEGTTNSVVSSPSTPARSRRTRTRVRCAGSTYLSKRPQPRLMLTSPRSLIQVIRSCP